MITRYLAPLTAVLALLLSTPRTARAQPQSETYPYSTFRIQAPQLPIPTNAVASYGGAPGGSTWSYWVYATYTGGASGLSNRATVVSVGAISGGTPVQVAWAAQAGATSYTVLKTANQTQPAAGCACVLAAGVTVPRATDTGGALTNWTVPTQPGLTYGNFILNQRDFAVPTWVFTPPLNVGAINFGSGEANRVVVTDAAGAATTNGNLTYNATGSILTHTSQTGFDGFRSRGFAAFPPAHRFQFGNGTAAAPLYPLSGDILGEVAFDGWNQATGDFATGASIIVDAGSNWTASNNDASMDLTINETGTTGSGVTILTLQPGPMGVGVGYLANQLAGGLDGDLHVVDNRATTGDTEVVIQAGAGQASDLLQFQSNAGAAQSLSVRASFVVRNQNAALEPEDCVAGIVGSMYFDTDDQALCICANDGTDIEWVRSDDYTHGTGHCTF